MRKISVIMVCKNSSETIVTSIKSFLGQSYRNKELIIVDGGSSDRTLEIIEKFKKKEIRIFKKKNLGLYASLNFGIKKSSGEIIGILHSDDIYYSNKILNKINKNFNTKKYDAIYTDIVLVNQNKKVIRKWINSKIDYSLDLNWILPPHTGLYIKKNIFKNIGYYNEKYKISSDIEFMYKLFLNQKLKTKYLKLFSLKMLIGGLSTKSPFSVIKSNYEVYKILKSLNIDYPVIVIIKKIIIKIKQFFL